MDRDVRWFAMPIGMQISNVGSEVHRAIRWKDKQETEKMTNFCNKAIELLELTERDPKNRYRIGELDYAIEELRDFFLGDNMYNTTEQQLMRYYDAFIM